jgi:hypothetical protein
MPAVSCAVRRTRRIPWVNDFPLFAGVYARQPRWPLSQSGLSPAIWKQMKHRCRGGCDGPVGHKLDRLARSKGDPRSIRATSPYQVDAACTSVSWRDCAGKVRRRFCVAARYGLNASACGHAVQFPQLPALPRASRCTRGVRSNRHRLWSGGLLLTGDASQGAGVMHRSARQDCAVPRGISVVKHPLTLWTARVWRLALMSRRVSGVGDLRRFHRPALG